MPTSHPTRTAQLERISMWLDRADLALLRALYRRAPGGYTIHIRAATSAMCKELRTRLRETDRGRELLTKLGQEHIQ